MNNKSKYILLLFIISAVTIGLFSDNKNYKSEQNNYLTNQNASKEAKSLMKYLRDQQGKSIVSGQQDLSGAQWLKKNTGKYPAIVGFDLYDYSSASTVAHGWKSYQIEQAIQWHNKGGIVTFCWHWVAPNMKDNLNWQKGFYTKNTNFNLEYAMNNHQSDEYRLIIKDIDLIAIQLEKLQKAHVPVLFRPLHEADGRWFWWGAKGEKSAIELYRLLYNRLTYHHKLNNLIWVWNSSLANWYPGDKYVDIISYDSYPASGDTGTQPEQYAKLNKVVHGDKLIAMSENGTIPDPDLLRFSKDNWSWFMTWRENYLTDGKYNTIDHLNNVYHNEYVITLDKLPNN